MFSLTLLTYSKNNHPIISDVYPLPKNINVWNYYVELISGFHSFYVALLRKLYLSFFVSSPYSTANWQFYATFRCYCQQERKKCLPLMCVVVFSKDVSWFQKVVSSFALYDIFKYRTSAASLSESNFSLFWPQKNLLRLSAKISVNLCDSHK